MDYINLLHVSGMYEKRTAKIIPFRSIDIFENAVSAGTGNFLVDGPKETVHIDESILPEDTTFGVRISGDSMEPEFHDGQIAWVLQQESVANGEIGIFALNVEAYIKKLQNDKDGNCHAYKYYHYGNHITTVLMMITQSSLNVLI